MSVAEALYRIQQRDQRTDALRRRQRDIQAAMAEPASVLDTRSAARQAQQTLHNLQSQLQDAELERQSLNTKISAEEKRLYSGRVTNIKEMTGLESEINSLKKRLTRLDDTILETMLAIEEAQTVHTTARDKLEKIERRWNTHLANLREQLAAVEGELVELSAELKTMRAELSAVDLNVYDLLYRAKGGRAVSHITQGRCEGCQVALPNVDIAAARQPGLAYCSHCGRILLSS